MLTFLGWASVVALVFLLYRTKLLGWAIVIALGFLLYWTKQRCPHCREWIDTTASHCKYCTHPTGFEAGSRP